MDRGKFYQLAESYKRINQTSSATNNKPQDIFVNIPVNAQPIPQLSETDYSTASIRQKALANSQVDERIKRISQMAEQQFVEQRRKEIADASELAKKNERDAILIPHRVKVIKEQNLAQNATCVPQFSMPLVQSQSSQEYFDRPRTEAVTRKEDEKCRVNRLQDEEQNGTEKYLRTKEGTPLTRDFVIPTRKKDMMEDENAKRLRDYLNTKKIKEKHYIPHNLVASNSPDSKKLERDKERLAQKCAKLVAAAQFKLKKGQTDSALEELSAAVSEGIRHADVFYMLGEVCRVKGMLVQSVEYLTKALRFQLHSPYTYYSLGKAYNSLGEYEKAVKVLQHFLDLIEVPEAHFELAKALSQLEDRVDSVVHVTRAIELDPNCAQYYAYRAEIYELQGFLELAAKDYSKALDVDHKFLDKYYKEYEELENAGNYVMAAKVKNFIDKVMNAS
eukprot:TRINITY_DN1800_c0_g1_i10.p1 TRINITY_DN1800_c0_g1~~TRINITY_DN1800_c0_g1_i10.p1  ORF type:complete len:447 (-),score=111.87 TRINITY_DN1800_c0_g1_i10:49-1389(-)